MRVLDLAVNVSTVPQRSPFRYPGGKTWLIPVLRKWLTTRKARPSVFVEPFAGGASASLLAVAEDFTSAAYFAEIDTDVAALWRCVLSEHGLDFARQVGRFKVSRRTVQRLFTISRGRVPLTIKALAVLVRNRVQRGGVLAPGAGRLKEGEAGKGLTSRWYPETLKKRLTAIYASRGRLHFVHGDGFALLERFAHHDRAVVFVDPPYFKAAVRLYPHWQIDHPGLFSTLTRFRGDFLLAYDDAPQIREWAAQCGFESVAIEMRTAHHRVKRELLIARTLAWLD